MYSGFSHPILVILKINELSSNLMYHKLDRKHYVLEPRFGADPSHRNPAILKLRDPLGVRPCFSFAVTVVAKIRLLSYFGYTPVAAIRPL